MSHDVHYDVTMSMFQVEKYYMEAGATAEWIVSVTWYDVSMVTSNLNPKITGRWISWLPGCCAGQSETSTHWPIRLLQARLEWISQSKETSHPQSPLDAFHWSVDTKAANRPPSFILISQCGLTLHNWAFANKIELTRNARFEYSLEWAFFLRSLTFAWQWEYSVFLLRIRKSRIERRSCSFRQFGLTFSCTTAPLMATNRQSAAVRARMIQSSCEYFQKKNVFMPLCIRAIGETVKPRLHDATFVEQHSCSWTSMEIGACLNILEHSTTLVNNVRHCWTDVHTVRFLLAKMCRQKSTNVVQQKSHRVDGALDVISIDI